METLSIKQLRQTTFWRSLSSASPSHRLIAYTWISYFFLVCFLPISCLSITFSIPPGNDVVGNIIYARAQKGDSLTKIGTRYGIGKHEMLAANPTLRRKRLKPGQTVTVPQLFILPPRAYRRGIVINISELRLYFFPSGGRRVMTYPVALGRSGWRTPTMKTKVKRKKANPTWYVPKSIRQHNYRKTGRWLPHAVPSGPRNPLGYYALYLGKPRYLIHGNNNPSSIGTLASSGCIRLHNRDIEELFHAVNPGSPVTIIHHAYKAGWRGGTLYLEAHKPISHNEYANALNHTLPEDVITRATLYTKRFNIRWPNVNKVLKQVTGIPEAIGSGH